MDVLLVRQYDLLRCLDTNRATKRSGDESLDTTGNSRKAMMSERTGLEWVCGAARRVGAREYAHILIFVMFIDACELFYVGQSAFKTPDT